MARERKRKRVTFDEVFGAESSICSDDISEVPLDDSKDDCGIKSSPSWQHHVLHTLFPTALTLSEYLTECCVKHDVSPNHVTTSRSDSQYQQLLVTTIVVPFCQLKATVRIARTNERGASERMPAILRAIVHESLRMAPPPKWINQTQFARQKRRSEPFKEAIHLSSSLLAIGSVLAQGYAIQDGNASSALRGEPVLVSNDSNSLMNNLLLSQEWVSVLKRIGEGLFRHLLYECFVFVALPNRCFLQLAGPRLDEVIRRQSNKLSPVSVTAPVRSISDPSSVSGQQLIGNKRSHSSIEPAAVASEVPIKRIKKASNPVCVNNRYVARHNLLFQTDMYVKIGLGDQHIFNTIPSRTDPSSTACSVRSIRNLISKVLEIPRDSHPPSAQPVSRSDSGLRPPSRSNSGLAPAHRSNSGLAPAGRTGSGLDAISCSNSNNLAQPSRAGSDSSSSSLNPAQRSVSFDIPEIHRKKHVRLPSGLQSLVPIFTSLIQRHRNCYYHLMFDRHVPVPFTSSQLGILTFDELTSMEAPVAQVHSFVRAAILNVFPLALFGSEHNRSHLLRIVSTFISLRRGESMRTQSIMYGIRINDMKWLADQSMPTIAAQSYAPIGNKRRRVMARGVHILSQLTPALSQNIQHKQSSRSKIVASGHLKREQLAATLFHFLLAQFVVPLIRSAFHCTDSEFGKNRICFYPHRVWSNIQRRAMTSFTTVGPSVQNAVQAQFTKLPRNAHESAARIRNRLGLGHLRLKPRKAGVRPIINMARPSKLSGHAFAPVNKVLRPVFDAITFERSQDTGMMGASVFGLNDIYLRYRTFVVSVRTQNQPDIPLYFTSLDVASCFDFINRQKLIGLSSAWFQQSRYTHHPYYTVRTKLDSSAGRFQRFSLSLALNTPSFDMTVQELAKRSRATVFVDLVKRTGSDKKHVERLLRDHVTANLVWYNGDIYRQERGIPQGSTLSALLCCAYVGHCETQIIFPQLGFTNLRVSTPSQLFMRQMDDFLHVTSDPQLAAAFPGIVKQALSSYQMEINERKTRIICSTDLNALMPWSGLLIDPSTLSVRRDSLRYAAAPMRDQLRIEFERRPGAALAASVRRTVQHNANPIFFDPVINPLSVIVLNLSELFVVSAIKCQSQAWALKQHPATFINEKMLFAAIEESVRLSWHLIVAGIRHNVLPGTPTSVSLCSTCRSSTCANAIRPYFPLSSHQCRWLAMRCFSIVFQRKHQRFSLALQLIKQACLDIQYRRPCRNKQLVTQSSCVCCNHWQFIQQEWSRCAGQANNLIAKCRF